MLIAVQHNVSDVIAHRFQELSGKLGDVSVVEIHFVLADVGCVSQANNELMNCV